MNWIGGLVEIADDVSAGLDTQAQVTLAAWSGWSQDGTPTYYAAAAYGAIIDKKQGKVVSPAGVEVMTDTIVFIPQPVVVTAKDQLTLPDGTTPQIQAVESPLDNDGNPYTAKIYCGGQRE